MLQLTSHPDDLSTAVNLLRAGELVALPFETVYGLAADATNPDALRAIFRAKGRPADHPLIVHLAATEQLSDWVTEVPEVVWRLASAFWPGPLTLVLPAARTVSPLVTGGQTTVALRVPAHPVPQAVLRQFGRGLAAPSANPFGQISPTTAAHVRRHLAGKIAAVVDGGPCLVGIESTIVDLSREHPRILRPGAITTDMLARHLFLAGTVAAAAPRVPGSRPGWPRRRFQAGVPGCLRSAPQIGRWRSSGRCPRSPKTMRARFTRLCTRPMPPVARSC